MEPQSTPERQKSDPTSTLPQTVQAFLCPVSAFPCSQGDFDPPWSRQLMTMLLATGSSAFSVQTALPVLKFAYKNLRVPESDSSFLMTFFFKPLLNPNSFPFTIMGMHVRCNIFKFSKIAKFWGSKFTMYALKKLKWPGKGISTSHCLSFFTAAFNYLSFSITEVKRSFGFSVHFRKL